MSNAALDDAFSPEDFNALLVRHVAFEKPKLVSYLPISTIEKVLKISVPEYQLLITRAGHQSAVIDSRSCCIASGAVYAFNEAELDAVLDESYEFLSELGWPRNTRRFIEKIAAEWYEMEHPILPLIRRIFGEAM
jgi:hypothetical protein